MKHVIWLGSSYQDLLNFPKEAKQVARYNLDKLQRGQEPSDWKTMASVGTESK